MASPTDPIADAVNNLTKSVSTVQYHLGTYVSANSDGSVNIDFGQGSVTCQSAGFFQPLPGMSVRCLQIDSVTLMLGPSVPILSVGTVTATGSPKITVNTSAGSQQLPYLTSYTPTVGDSVDIDWASGGIVLGKTTAVPAGVYTPTTSGPQSFSADFRANDSGTWSIPGGDYFTGDVWCTSTGHDYGAWFYGTTIADTIPDNATITSVQLYLDEFFNEYPAQLALIGLHSLTAKSGAPSISSAVQVSAGSGFKSLPTSFGDALKTGSEKGVGTGSTGASGYHKFSGVGSDAQCGLLRIGWTV